MTARGAPWDTQTNPSSTYFSPTRVVAFRGVDVTKTNEGTPVRLSRGPVGTAFGISNQPDSLYNLSVIAKFHDGDRTIHFPPGRGLDFLVNTAGNWEITIGTISFDGDGSYVATSGVWDGNIIEPSELTTPYDVGMIFVGTPTDTQVMGELYIPREIDFGANFIGSGGSVQVNPTASFDIDVQDDTVTIGTITVSTGGVFSFATAGGTAKTVAAGSFLTFVGPSPADATISDISFTLAASTTE